MPIDLFLSQLSPTMSEGRIVRWHIHAGEPLVPGALLLEVETDKAVMEVEANQAGTLYRILAAEGALVPVGSPIAILAEEGEEVPADYHSTPVEALAVVTASEAGPHGLTLKAGGMFNPDGDYDLAVIGAGPGGYVAAIRAAQLGMRVAVIESTHLGGICLNWGCIPTKALLRTAEIVNVIRGHGAELGLGVSDTTPDLAQAVARSRTIADKLSKGIGFLLKKNKIATISGHARFEAGNRLLVTTTDGEQQVTARRVIVATGARARAFPGMEIDGEVVIAYKAALARTTLPAQLIVIGSGAIGMEFAWFYRAMGAEVTILEAAEQILPLEDHEIARVVERGFKKQGIKTIVGARVTSARNVEGRAVVEYELKGQSQQLTGDCCLVAVGVVGNVEAIGAERTRMRIERGAIAVDGYYRTDHPGIYAIGDVVGAPALAHVASHEGIVCVEAIAGLAPHPVDYGNVPGCTYCQPQVGSTGLTEKQCKEQGLPIKIGRMPYAPNGKALGLAETDGMVKTIFHAETGELLGAHIVGAEATEMIVTLGLARTLKAGSADLAHHMFPHPTLSEMLHEAALDAEGRAIHL